MDWIIEKGTWIILEKDKGDLELFSAEDESYIQNIINNYSKPLTDQEIALGLTDPDPLIRFLTEKQLTKQKQILPLYYRKLILNK